jgi:hypothetical protein
MLLVGGLKIFSQLFHDRTSFFLVLPLYTTGYIAQFFFPAGGRMCKTK